MDRNKIVVKQTIPYPNQVASLIQRKNGEFKTLGVDCALSRANETREAEKSMPLEMHSGFSRFVFTLLKKSNESKQYVKANIPADDIMYIFEKTKLSMQEILAAKRLSGSEKLSSAYTERFSMGTYKGKTPAEILIETPNERKNLIKQGEFLSKNLEKFPANKKMIIAIKEALNLQKENKLENKNTNSGGSVVTVYNEQVKALKSTKNEKGLCLVYGIKITCDTSRNLPFMIEIQNCYAPIDIGDDGIMNPRMREAENIQKIFMNMTEKDWYKVINRCYQTVCSFESVIYRHQALVANYVSQKNRLSAQQAAGEK